jgi:hypothetical protein
MIKCFKEIPVTLTEEITDVQKGLGNIKTEKFGRTNDR